MKLCFGKVRQSDCFCSGYDENRQTMFYCGFFSTLAGFIWFLIGFGLRCAYFTQALGPSVTAVACGIMVVGIMVLVIGLGATLSVVCRGKGNNKTTCISSRDHGKHKHRNQNSSHSRKQIFFDSPVISNWKDCEKQSQRAIACRNESFESNSSAELNPSSSSLSSSPTSSSTMYSSRPSTTSHQSTSTNHHSYKSDIAFIA